MKVPTSRSEPKHLRVPNRVSEPLKERSKRNTRAKPRSERVPGVSSELIATRVLRTRERAVGQESAEIAKRAVITESVEEDERAVFHERTANQERLNEPSNKTRSVSRR
jgi:hypothetical protein